MREVMAVVPFDNVLVATWHFDIKFFFFFLGLELNLPSNYNKTSVILIHILIDLHLQ